MPTDFDNINFDNINYVRFPAGGNKKEKKELKQVVTSPADLASVINVIGYKNVLNIIPCNSYNGCIIIVLYKE